MTSDEFKYSHLIPDKYRQIFWWNNPPVDIGGRQLVAFMRIDHFGKAGQHGLDLGFEESDMKLPDKKFYKRFLGPGLALLEAHISQRESELTHSPQSSGATKEGKP